MSFFRLGFIIVGLLWVSFALIAVSRKQIPLPVGFLKHFSASAKE